MKVMSANKFKSISKSASNTESLTKLGFKHGPFAYNFQILSEVEAFTKYTSRSEVSYSRTFIRLHQLTVKCLRVHRLRGSVTQKRNFAHLQGVTEHSSSAMASLSRKPVGNRLAETLRHRAHAYALFWNCKHRDTGTLSEL